MAAWRLRGAARVLAGLLVAAGAAHLLFGRMGWMHRYEHYILVVLAAGGMIAFGWSGAEGRGLAVRFGGLACLGGALLYGPVLVREDIWSPRAIHLQQDQMARFAQGFLKAPVAVNDVGRVSWGNLHYVLDLWGLASQQARRLRLSVPPPAPGWAGPLAARHGVEAAMIYDSWLKDAVPAGWVPMAELTMDDPRGGLGGTAVTFYATGPAEVAPVAAALRAFAPGLPAAAHLAKLGQGW